MLRSSKPRKCCICKTNEVANKFARLCVNMDCILTFANRDRDKRLRKEQAKRAKLDREDTKRRKENLKSRSDWLRETQMEFNRMRRLEDQLAGYRCISCDTGNLHVKMNAGHFLSVGAHPELRFTESNVHLQCEKCNTHLSGNISAYRPRLIERIGLAAVEWLEGPHPPGKWSIDELKVMKAVYRKVANEIQKQNTEEN